jgi:hypothetical protein
MVFSGAKRRIEAAKNPFNALPFNGPCVLDPTQGLAPYRALPVSNLNAERLREQAILLGI